ncbi:MAG: lytic transglycosylase domain-containing protein [Candidatus Pacebacteria bacterium]|nr:lytic transglycosylase domain-containing protein [Candidatus Paceibacterota bacterium]MCF7857352.1 lytic transglycosylase domain-containing protein [Candidatus Paceibacterota bacterium]
MSEGTFNKLFSGPKEKKSEKQLPVDGNEPANPARRKFLIGSAALAGSALAGAYLIGRENDDVDESISEDSPSFPSAEKLSELQFAREKIRACVESIQKSPFMEKPQEAKNALENVVVNTDHTSVVLGIEEADVMSTLHIQDVRELSEQIRNRNGKGDGGYTHQEGNNVYNISLEDTVVDIGVSNRFLVKKYSSDGTLSSSSLPVYAVKRSRYEKKQTTHTTVGKNGKEKKVKETTGDYVEYVPYIPPSSHLVSKESVGSGKEYVGTVLEAAHSVLSHRMLKSNQRVLSICHDICKRLAIVEHVDPIALIKSEKKEGNETELHVEDRRKTFYQKMYAEYGLNQDASFNHLINSLGAGGMMQIMRKTYEDIRARMIVRKIFLPDEIPEDANEGRKDPLISAIIAMYLCYDNYLVKGKVLTGKRDDEIELALVSMYNGSPNLFRKILKGEEVKKAKRGKKVKNKSLVSGKKPSVSYPNATPFIYKLLTHNQGAKLPGSSQSENGNYLRKYLWLKMNEGKV